AGETLLRSVRPALEEIASGVDAASALRGKPSGTVRITATKHAVSSVVMPVLPGFLASHPDIRVDILVDDNLTDIVANRIDAGRRLPHWLHSLELFATTVAMLRAHLPQDFFAPTLDTAAFVMALGNDP